MFHSLSLSPALFVSAHLYCMIIKSTKNQSVGGGGVFTDGSNYKDAYLMRRFEEGVVGMLLLTAFKEHLNLNLLG